jgi:hypothetical protein
MMPDSREVGDANGRGSMRHFNKIILVGGVLISLRCLKLTEKAEHEL